MLKKIVSGGQTGADRAALDLAIEKGIPHGGWIPQGRLTENGPLPEKYSLHEMPTSDYSKRTERNVIDSDATLIISHGPLSGGSAYTLKMAGKHHRPCLHLDLEEVPLEEAASTLSAWLSSKGIEILNVAGPRASQDPWSYEDTRRVLEVALEIAMTGP